MLRRKFLIVFGSLVILLAVMGVSAIWLLQGVLHGLDHVRTEATRIVDDTGRLHVALSAIEIDLYQLQLGQERHLNRLISDMITARKLVAAIGEHYIIRDLDTASTGLYRDLATKFPPFERQVGLLATVQDAQLALEYNMRTSVSAMELRESVQRIDAMARGHARKEHLELTGQLRWLILGMALGYLLVVNVSIVVLWRASSMVLKPMDKLVEASRQLTGERLDYRAEVTGNDEFAELANGYNTLAERLQADQQRRMEMLGQVALTLNHELNNAIATIEIQLQLLGRGSTSDGKFKSGLRHIRDGLHRMTQTVQSLKHIRRIVLTDYVAGVKMLDLQRSVAEAPPDEAEVCADPTHEVEQS